jgi:hypothetical protein
VQSYKNFSGRDRLMHLGIHKKLSHYTPRRRLCERRYSSYSFSTLTLDGGERSASRPGRALSPGKGPPVPIVQEAGWAPEPVWTQRLQEKSFRLCRGSNLDCPFVQPVARQYTDWATRLTSWNISQFNIKMDIREKKHAKTCAGFKCPGIGVQKRALGNTIP